eukprot:m.225430 g.225430  ORF g.225430 m.225430 type:complete len:143 (-) comp15957_c2_seq2:2036-2464(-)
MMGEPQQEHVLELDGPPGNGVNVGMAVDTQGNGYKWEGDVKDGKANGFGTKTYLSGTVMGYVYYGEYKDGNEWGNRVEKHPDGTMYFNQFENGTYRGLARFTSSKALHKETMDMVIDSKFSACFHEHYPSRPRRKLLLRKRS